MGSKFFDDFQLGDVLETQGRTVTEADMAIAMGGWAERVEDPSDVGAAILRARRATEDGRAALLEFMTSEEIDYSVQPPLS